MSLPSILSDGSSKPKEVSGAHIVDKSLKNYFDSFPSESLIRQMLSQAFVINQPMQGVGGDGYWLQGENDTVHLIVFDCMGHGRMASIMTRIYISAIRKTLEVQRSTDPGLILKHIHENIQTSLNPGITQQVGSGADVAVIKLEIDNRSLEYAGAKMDLVYASKGDIIRIKAHKRQVGDHYDIARVYETVEVPLLSDEPISVYLFSDGVTDLIGGPNHKKFKFKNLKPILVEAHELPIDQARAHVLNQLEEWDGNEGRLDDLLMIGVRI